MSPLGALFVIFVVAIVVNTLIVMFAARLVGAGKTHFGAALLAVFLQGLLAFIALLLLHSLWALIAVLVIVGSFIYSRVMDTTFLRRLGIGILTTIISFLIRLILLSGLGLMASG